MDAWSKVGKELALSDLIITGTGHDLSAVLMHDPNKYWVAIIGAGASGAQFLRERIAIDVAAGRTSVGYHLIDPNPVSRDGRGVAWTPHQRDSLLTNMHLDRIGQTIPNLSDAFKRLNSYHFESGELFQSRKEVGDALNEAHQKTIEFAAEQGIDVQRHNASVTDISSEHSRFKINLSYQGEPTGSNHLFANTVVFALGHFPSTKYTELKSSSNYVHNPWNWDEIKPPAGEDKIVGLIGLGPTAVDVITVLEETGFAGHIESYSRTGTVQYPRPKYDSYKPTVLNELTIKMLKQTTGKFTMDMLSALIVAEFAQADCSADEALAAAKQYENGPMAVLSFGLARANQLSKWFSVLKCVDDITPLLWSVFDDEAREEYVRTYRKLHTSISYGMSSNQALRLQNWLNSARLSIHSNLASISAKGERFEIRLNSGISVQRRMADYLINCSGVGTDLLKVEDQLIANLIGKGIIEPHPRGGTHCDFETGQFQTADGTPKGKLFTLVGSLNYGTRLLTHCYSEVEKSAIRTAKAVEDLVLAARATS